MDFHVALHDTPAIAEARAAKVRADDAVRVAHASEDWEAHRRATARARLAEHLLGLEILARRA